MEGAHPLQFRIVIPVCWLNKVRVALPSFDCEVLESIREVREGGSIPIVLSYGVKVSGDPVDFGEEVHIIPALNVSHDLGSRASSVEIADFHSSCKRVHFLADHDKTGPSQVVDLRIVIPCFGCFGSAAENMAYNATRSSINEGEGR